MVEESSGIAQIAVLTNPDHCEDCKRGEHCGNCSCCDESA